MNEAPHSLIVVGGGAAGYFAAITAAGTHPGCSVMLLERSAHPLAKVRISGGGRCNVTHACFDPKQLVTYYPRGGSALRGPFTRFQPRDIMAWFESHGVPLKTEEDGRVFPVSDRSESITECLEAEAKKAGVKVRVNAHIHGIEASPPAPLPVGEGSKRPTFPPPPGEGGPSKTVGEARRFKLDLGADQLECDRLILATGSNPQGWEWAQALGHTLVPPVPSLFTFAIADARLDGLSGLSVPAAEVSISGTKLKQKGPLLITHWGLSGPAVLKLSAWGAREFHARNYQAEVRVNWIGEPADPLLERLKRKREKHATNLVLGDNLPDLPRRLWARLALAAKLPETVRWGEVGNASLRALAGEITHGAYLMTGKSTFKEEFVTAGGVPLDEVDFRTLESKRCPGLFFAGEILDIDGITGGFNFQNAWTTGWIAGQSV